jgi:hypothetical protein
MNSKKFLITDSRGREQKVQRIIKLCVSHTRKGKPEYKEGNERKSRK